MKVSQYIPQALTFLGLTEGEAALYVKILNNPGISIPELKKLTGYSTAGVYKIVNALSDRGFVHASESTPSVFTATPLGTIAQKFAAQGRKLERVASKLADISKLTKIPLETDIYESDDLTNYYLNIPYKIDDFIWCVGSFDAVMAFLGQDTEKEFIKNRVKRGMRADAIIFDKSDKSKDLAQRDILEKRETKFIQCGEYPLEFSYLFGNTHLNFYRDSEGKLKVLRTDSPEFARAKLMQYQAMWNSTAQ